MAKQYWYSELWGPKPVVFQGWCLACADEVWSKKDGTKFCRKCQQPRIKYRNKKYKELGDEKVKE